MKVIIKLRLDLRGSDAGHRCLGGIDTNVERVTRGHDAVVNRRRFNTRHLGDCGGDFGGDRRQRRRILGAEFDHNRLRAAHHIADHVAEKLMRVEGNPRDLAGNLIVDVVHHGPD